MQIQGTHRRWIGVALAVLVIMLVPWQRSYAVDGPVAWSPKGPFGGSVLAIAIDPIQPHILYAGTGGGVYRSEDGGAHWALASMDFTRPISTLAIDLDHPWEVYAGTLDLGIYKSEDGGATWRKLNTGEHTSPQIQTLIIAPPTSPAVSTLVYAGTASSLLRSFNHGVTWQRLEYFNVVNTIAIHPRQGWVLYVGTNSGLYKSFDNGHRWALIGEGIPEDLDIQALVIDPNTPNVLYAGTWGGGVYKSVDDGLTWSPSNLGIETAFVYTLAIDLQSPTILYAATDQGLFKSENGGAAWRRTLDGKTRSIAVSSLDSKTVYVGQIGDGVMKSGDAGENWTPVNEGLTNVHVSSIMPSPVVENALLVGTYGGLWLWDHDRDRWQSTTMTDSVMSMAASPSSPTTLFAASPRHIYKSEDGGITWQNIANLGMNRVLAVHPQNDQILYVGTWNDLYKSKDGGVTWEKTGLTKVIVGDILLDPNSPQTVYVGTWGDDTMYKSEDGGATWRIINRGITQSSVWSLAMDPDDAHVLFAGTAGRLFKSEDAGESWHAIEDEALPFTYYEDLVFDARAPKTLYAATPSGLFQSTDGGEHWRRLGLGRGQDITTALPDPDSRHRLYVGTMANGLYEGRALSLRLYLPQLRKSLSRVNR